MKQLLIQLLLVVGVLAVSWRLLVSYGQKAQAVRRLGLLLFAAFAVWTILFPDFWTRIAKTLGIGRGADLILYGLVIAFLGFVVTTFKRFRSMEVRYTRLARRIALDEAPSPLRPHLATTSDGALNASVPPTVDEPADDGGVKAGDRGRTPSGIADAD